MIGVPGGLGRLLFRFRRFRRGRLLFRFCGNLGRSVRRKFFPLLGTSGLGAHRVHKAGQRFGAQVQLGLRRGHGLKVRQIAFQRTVRVVLRGCAVGGVVLRGLALDGRQFAAHLTQVIQECGALSFQLPDLAPQIVQPELMGVLDLVGLGRSGIHQLLGLLPGLLPGRHLDGGGVGAGLLLNDGGLDFCLLHHLVRLGFGILHRLGAALLHKGAGLVQGAALDAQLGFRLLGALPELVFLFLQAAVLEPQHGALVAQRVIALLQGGHPGVQVLLLAGVGLAAARQRRVLAGKPLVLGRKRLAVLLQGSILLRGFPGLTLRPAQALFIFAANGLKRCADVLRLIAAKTRLAHPALFHKLCHIDLWHGRILPAPNWVVCLTAL